jgi:hypothetical protein
MAAVGARPREDVISDLGPAGERTPEDAGGSVACALVAKRRSSSSIAAALWGVTVGKRLRRMEDRAPLATVGQWHARSKGPGAPASSFKCPARLDRLGIPGTSAS